MKKVRCDKGSTVTLMDVPMKDGIEYERGMALTLSDGAAIKAVGDVQAVYVAYETKTGVAGGYIRCARVSDTEVYECECADTSAVNVGDRLKFAEDGINVTANKATNYGAEIVAILESGENGRVEVRI